MNVAPVLEGRSTKAPSPALALAWTCHRRRRLFLLLGALATMLAATAVLGAEAIGWLRDGYFAAFSIAVLASALLVLWLRSDSRLSVTATARALDQRWATQAKIESALELASQASSLAGALRQEADQATVGRRPPQRWLWYASLAVVTLLAALAVTEFALRAWPRTRNGTTDRSPIAARAADTTGDSPAKRASTSSSASGSSSGPAKAQKNGAASRQSGGASGSGPEGSHGTGGSGPSSVNQLRSLARKQEQLARALENSQGGAGSAAVQSDLAREAEAVAKKTSAEKAREAASRAAGEAQTAAARLGAGDTNGARLPAAAAARALEVAAQEQEKVGRAEALVALNAARRGLNTASAAAEPGNRRAALDVAVKQLDVASEAEQRDGLADVAAALRSVSEGFHALDGSAAGSSWAAQVRRAATAHIAIADRHESIVWALRELEHGRSLVEQGMATGREDLLLASQLARELLAEGPAEAAARTLMLASTPGSAPPANERLFTACDAVTRALLKLRTESEREERVRRFNADEIDPAYRGAVENYFERLSREGAPP